MSTIQKITVGDDEAEQRLDRWFRRKFAHINQSNIEKMCRKGEIRVNGGRVKSSTRVSPGQIIRIPPLPSFDEIKQSSGQKNITRSDAEMIRNCVIYKDDYLLVLNKPAGLAVQGGSKQNRHVDGMTGALTFEREEAPRLVHRLDKDTSGVLLLARTQAMASELTKAFRHQNTRKIYWALVAGTPVTEVGTIRFSLNRMKLSSGYEKMVPIPPVEEINYPNSKRAVTDYAVIEKVSQRATWLGLSPITGRTHQLRSHMAAIGCPIVGDTKYGVKGQINDGEGWGAQIGGIISRKLHLHARSIGFHHPITKKFLFFEAELPVHMATAWNIFNWNLKWAPKDPFKKFE